METRRKVIAFDSWTGGAVNIERLVDAFARNCLDLFLIHVGSWGHDLNRPKEEYIGQLLVRDISYYKRKSFFEILHEEKPDAVLFLSTTAFLHRAFNRYCAQLGIPSLHLYHGIICVQSTNEKRPKPLNPYNQILLIVNRFWKQVRRIIPIYGKSLCDTHASASEWFQFVSDIWAKVIGTSYEGIAAQDAMTTACCVYTEWDMAHAMNRYRMNRKAITVVGNPDLVNFGVKDKDIGECLEKQDYDSKDIMYIDTAFNEIGCVFNSREDFVRHLLMTKRILAEQGFSLLVKLHPIHTSTSVPEALRSSGTKLVTSDEFVGTLKRCVAAIVEPSSAALIPALFGVPLLLAKYGKLSQLTYGEALMSYPLAHTLDSIDHLSQILSKINSSRQTNAILKWIGENAGPLPAEKMPERVAETVKLMIAKAQHGQQ